MHPAEAAADLRRAFALWEKGKSEVNETHFERSRALALLAGLAADAKSGVTKAEAATFADQVVAALADAVSAGWSWPNDLKEPDFDALRGRADFQKLVAEVEAKAGKPPAKLIEPQWQPSNPDKPPEPRFQYRFSAFGRASGGIGPGGVGIGIVFVAGGTVGSTTAGG